MTSPRLPVNFCKFAEEAPAAGDVAAELATPVPVTVKVLGSWVRAWLVSYELGRWGIGGTLTGHGVVVALAVAFAVAEAVTVTVIGA